ncbi:MAG: PadR family transcriptional regulator [Terriglobales bacterium]
MRPRNKTRFAVLGLLSLGPMSGYDIKKLVGESIGHFWSESYGQLYPVLRRLTAEGRVKRKEQRGAGRPGRIVYSLTPAGQETLAGWLREPPRPQPHRSELLLKLFFGERAPVAVSRRHVEEFRALNLRFLQTYAQVERELRRSHASHPGLPWWLITLSFGRRRSQAFVHWADETLETLQTLERTRRRGRSKTKKARS